jgi:predicted nucleic acid-binding protein
MTAVFADSYYYFALVNPRDPAHAKATAFAERDDRSVVTTGWVLTEVADGLSNPDWRPLVLGLYAELTANPKVRIVPCTDELFTAGLDLYARRPDKQWSLTDCVSFVVMGRDGIGDALTGDKHFEQAGFQVLLK